MEADLLAVLGRAWGLLAVVVLGWAAFAKLLAPEAVAAVWRDVARRPVGSAAGVVVAACAEMALAAALALQLAAAEIVAAVVFGVFAVVHGGLVVRRGLGTPCGCFGPRSRVGVASTVGTVCLAAGQWAMVAVGPRPVGDAAAAWSLAGVAVAALVTALGIVREQARRLVAADGPSGALEVDGEGPPLGAVAALPVASAARVQLAVFLSPACPLCRRLEEQVRWFGQRPAVALELYDEERDAELWRALDVPGSPYALAHDRDGRVWAKGAFNTVRQLESVLATAHRRLDEGLARADAA